MGSHNKRKAPSPGAPSGKIKRRRGVGVAMGDGKGRGSKKTVSAAQKAKLKARELYPELMGKQLTEDAKIRVAIDNEFFHFVKSSAKNASLHTLAHVWDISRQQLNRILHFARRAQFVFHRRKGKKQRRTIITDAALAAERLTPLHFYLQNHAGEEKMTAVERKAMEQRLITKWQRLHADERERYKFASRSAMAAHPFIERWLLYELKCDPHASFVQLANSIGNWCSANTIQRWWNSSVTAVLLGQRFIPLLSERQRRAHVDFALHVKNNWGRGRDRRKRILWVHWDEKWFWGYLLRKRAKLDRARGLTQRGVKIKNKQHVPKAMFVCFSAYAFIGNPLNGGDGIKLGMVRAKKAKLNQRDIRERVDDPVSGTYTFSGPVLRKKGDVRMVDANVSGSSQGTLQAPKFDLKSVFVDHLIPMLREITGPGGSYENYDVIIQGDNAGPHREGVFSATMQRCIQDINRELGGRARWMWEPQAPHMPHSNVCDLALFPSLSKRVQRLARKKFKGKQRVLSTSEIEECVLGAWKAYESCKVARTFLQAYLMMDKVIQEKGDTGFLTGGSFHFGVGPNYVDTDKGVRRKKKK